MTLLTSSLEVRIVLLDIFKAFGKLWYKGWLQVKCMGIDENFLKKVESLLSNRSQHAVLNGQASCWADLKAGVSQGSILGPLFFL